VAKSKGGKSRTNGNNGATLGFEQTLWLAADKLRNNMDAAEYKHIVLGLIFLKYVSDAFEEKYAALKRDKGADAEDPDEYKAENVFWVPKESRWSHLRGNAKQPAIGKIIDDAMDAIERDNRSLKGVLPGDYNRPGLDKTRLGELIDLIGTISMGDAEHRSRTSSAASMNIFSPNSPAPKEKKAASSIPRDVWSVCWLRCSRRIVAGFMTRVAAPAECSCSRLSSSNRIGQEMGTVARPRRP
jgi:HsdM N-terminal domain